MSQTSSARLVTVVPVLISAATAVKAGVVLLGLIAAKTTNVAPVVPVGVGAARQATPLVVTVTQEISFRLSR